MTLTPMPLVGLPNPTLPSPDRGRRFYRGNVGFCNPTHKLMEEMEAWRRLPLIRPCRGTEGKLCKACPFRRRKAVLCETPPTLSRKVRRESIRPADFLPRGEKGNISGAPHRGMQCRTCRCAYSTHATSLNAAGESGTSSNPPPQSLLVRRRRCDHL
jgi:hypothetical protein